MNVKLPPDAFDAYVALGTMRSYTALAEHYGVDRKTVLRRAQAENWQKRLVEIEQRARQSGDQKLAESIEQMNDRHLKTLRIVQGKAIQTLREMPLTTAMEAVRALDLSIRNERLIRGEPTDRNAVDVEQIIKREYERWLIRGDEPEKNADTPLPQDSTSEPVSSIASTSIGDGHEQEEDDEHA